jgi:hypothetical protein
MYLVIRKAEERAVIPETRIRYKGLEPKRTTSHALEARFYSSRELSLALRPRVILPGRDCGFSVPLKVLLSVFQLPSGALDVAEFCIFPEKVLDPVLPDKIVKGFSQLCAQACRLEVAYADGEIQYRLRVGKVYQATQSERMSDLQECYVIKRARRPRR